MLIPNLMAEKMVYSSVKHMVRREHHSVLALEQPAKNVAGKHCLFVCLISFYLGVGGEVGG